jgi:hypothetical protein
MKLFYATIDMHLDIPVVWEFTVKPRKDGSYKAEGMLSFMGYITILQKHHLADCGATELEAVEKLKKRKLRTIEQLDSKRDQIVSEVNLINSAPPRLIQFPIKPKSTVKVVI